MMTNDTVLLKQYALDQNADAFLALSKLYSGMVYGTCLRILNNTHDAEEVAQECFLQLARKAGEIKSSVPGWLHTVATNMSKQKIRGEVRRRAREEVVAEGIEGSGIVRDPSWQELMPHVDQAIVELPDDLKAPVILHYLEGKKQKEIAKTLGVNQSTVSRRLEDGIDQVRQTLIRGGIVTSITLIGTLISANAVVAAPASLSAALGKMAVSGASSSGCASASASGAAAASGITKTIAVVTATSAAVAGIALTAYVASKVNNDSGNTNLVSSTNAQVEDTAKPGTLFVSPEGTHVFPFNTIETASTNIQTAINTAAPGDTVLLGAGHYLLDSTITVDKALTIRGADKREETILDGQRKVRCMRLAGTNVLVEALTFTRGADSCVEVSSNAILRNCHVSGGIRTKHHHAGGGVVAESGALVDNCVIVSNVVTRAGGGGLFLKNARASRCLIADNVTKTWRGFGGGISMMGRSIIDSCLVTRNLTDSQAGGVRIYQGNGAQVRNCTIVGNLARGHTAAVSVVQSRNNPRIINSIIYGNIATGSTNGTWGPIPEMDYASLDRPMYGDIQVKGTAEYLNSCLPFVVPGEGNITNAPQFVDAERGDFRLRKGSPCVDAGTNQTWMTDDLDLYGKPRIKGDRVDIGAAEGSITAYALIANTLAWRGKPDAIDEANIFSPPVGNGRWYRIGLSIQADEAWMANGTSWDFNYSRHDTDTGLQILHPVGNGLVMLHITSDNVSVSSRKKWSEGGWRGWGHGTPLARTANFGSEFPIGETPSHVRTTVSPDGFCKVWVDGSIVATGAVSDVNNTIFDGGFREATKYGGSFPTNGILPIGTAGFIIAPTDSGFNKVTDLKFYPGVSRRKRSAKVRIIRPDQLRPVPIEELKEYPKWLEGSTIHCCPDSVIYHGFVEFEVTESGYLLLGVNFTYQGNTSGQGPNENWPKERWVKQDFIDNGWTFDEGILHGPSQNTPPNRRYELCGRMVKKGDTYKLRCNKYVPPFPIEALRKPPR